jgi:hypothetical protein
MDSLSPNAYQVWDGFMRLRYANENIRRQQDQEAFNIREAMLRDALAGEMQEQLRRKWFKEDTVSDIPSFLPVSLTACMSGVALFYKPNPSG